VPLSFALALFVLMDLANALRIGLEKPKAAVRAEWLRMAPAIVAGTLAGITLLVRLPRAAAMAALGAFACAFGLYSLASRPPAHAVLGARWAYVAGFAGGIASTLFGAGGPPYAIYLSQRGLAKEAFRATLGLATLASISLRALAFLAAGLLREPGVWLCAVAVVPAGLAGIWAARRLYRRISRKALARAVALVLLASGASLLGRALAERLAPFSAPSGAG